MDQVVQVDTGYSPACDAVDRSSSTGKDQFGYCVHDMFIKLDPQRQKGFAVAKHPFIN